MQIFDTDNAGLAFAVARVAMAWFVVPRGVSQSLLLPRGLRMAPLQGSMPFPRSSTMARVEFPSSSGG